jgi:hypothetical protein
LARLYGVTTKALNQAVKRNLQRFPTDFMFRLTKAEKAEAVTKCDRLGDLRFSPHLPYALTEHGALMAAGILNSDLAVKVSVEIVRAFVRLRQVLDSHAAVARKIRSLEKKYDAKFRLVFEAIRALMEPLDDDEPKKGRIGFKAD